MASPIVRSILSHYLSDNPGTCANLARLLMAGELGGTGNMVIYPVDQGFEHGPGRSFSGNPVAYDPLYHHRLAIDGGLSAYAAPLGMLERSAPVFPGQIPLILKINSGNSLGRSASDPLLAHQALTGSVSDALRLGCSAIGFTIYPGSDRCYDLMEQLRPLIHDAKKAGLAVIVWSYARGNMSKVGETALDTIAYGAHMAALMGAHIIKVKLPSDHLENPAASTIYKANAVPRGTLTDRVRHVVQCCFDGSRLVVFSGGDAKNTADVLTDARAIRDGGGSGSIIGRNCFMRPRDQALALLSDMIDVYKTNS